MQDRPSVDELLEAVAGYLQDDVMPNTTGRLSFHARVSLNVIQMLRRELSAEEDHLGREWDGLDALLGPEPAPQRPSELRAALLDRNEDLARRIREGEFDDQTRRAAALSHLRAILRDKLSVSNPALLAQEAP